MAWPFDAKMHIFGNPSFTGGREMAKNLELTVKKLVAVAIFFIFTSAYIIALASIWAYSDPYGGAYQGRLFSTAFYTVLYGLGLLIPLGIWEWRPTDLTAIRTCASCGKNFQTKIEYCPYCGEKI